jgi:hypothetical protein
MGDFFGAGRRGLGSGLFGGGGNTKTYAEILVDDYGADEVWPLVDIASGTDIPAFVNSNRDGTLTGWDLQNAAGPVTDTLAPYSDGANDYGDIHTSNGTDGLADIWDGEANLFMWLNSDTGFWTDDAYCYFLTLGNPGFEGFHVRKTGGNEIAWKFKTVGLSQISQTPSGWFSLGLSISLSDDEGKCFYNGSRQGAIHDLSGEAAGSITESWIMAESDGPFGVFTGWGAYVAVKFGSIWTPTDFQNMHDAAATAGAD